MEINLSHIKKRDRSRSRSQDRDQEVKALKSLQIPMFLTEDSPSKKYYSRPWARKKNVRHWGQRKLFITEVHFLTLYGHLSKNVIYAGSAPGNHIPYLSSLFPDHHFHLVDPNPFKAKKSSRITITNDYFTDELCEKYKQELSDYIFISDIRTADYKQMTAEDHEIHIQKDNTLQAHWVNLLKPLKSMIKFRCPYTSDYPHQTIQCLEGDILIQSWAPHSSTETRLIVDQFPKEKTYDIQKYEDQMFYHNDEVRIEKRFKHGVRGEGLEEDYDSAADLQVLLAYMEKYGKQESKALGRFSNEITRNLGCFRKLGTRNKPKEERRQFEARDHKQFYIKNNVDL